MRDYLDPVVKAGQSAQYAADNGIVANNACVPTRNNRAVFKFIRQTVLILTFEKCNNFGVRQVEFRGRTISREGISPQARKFHSFQDSFRIPKSKKDLQRHLRFAKYYKHYIPRMAEKFIPFFKLLKTKVPIKHTSELNKFFDLINKALADACELALKQPNPGTQLVLMTDASFTNVGYALNVEKIPTKRNSQSGKRTLPWRLAPKHSPPCNSRCPFTQNNFWQITWHFLTLHNFCGKQQSRHFFRQITDLSHVFSKRKQFHQHCGRHVLMYYNSTSK